MTNDLEITGQTFRPAGIRRTGASATAAYHAQYLLRGLGTWRLEGTIRLGHSGSHWRVQWTPATLHPELQFGSHFVRERTWPARAPILGAAGAPLVQNAGVVSIGLQGSAIKDPIGLNAALVQAGADPSRVTAALEQAATQLDEFVPVLVVTEGRYEALRPLLFPIPGTRFQRRLGRVPLTPDLGAHVVGTVAAITAEQLKAMGSPYEAGDSVGQNGIDASYERQLAGRPSGTVRIVDAGGRTIDTAASFAAQPGAPVQTSIDPHVQMAAERALDGVSQPAALVVMRPSSGEVTAIVSRPTAVPFDRALDGRYPPGSTFKVITAAALLANGLTLDSPVSCPPTRAVGGTTFHNFEGETQLNLPLHDAFATSCNTAFIGASAGLPTDALSSAADQFGFGLQPRMGLSAVSGSVPTPTNDVEKAAIAIGQGAVSASPLVMATVAATVASGTFHSPRLVVGAPDDTIAVRAIDSRVISALQAMMSEVVTAGTATGAGLLPGTLAKTGTAEFGNANPPSTHAWIIGSRDDVAFALIVEGGGVGGRVAAPLAAKFLGGL